MEKTLPPYEKALMDQFHCHLQRVRTVEDIFPPEGGVREPLTPPLPELPGGEALCLAAVYDLCIARQRRNALMQQGEELLEQIGTLV